MFHFKRYKAGISTEFSHLPHTSHYLQCFFVFFWLLKLGCWTYHWEKRKLNPKPKTKLILAGKLLSTGNKNVNHLSSGHSYLYKYIVSRGKNSPLQQSNHAVPGETPWFNIKPRKGHWYSNRTNTNLKPCTVNSRA